MERFVILPNLVFEALPQLKQEKWVFLNNMMFANWSIT